MPDFFRASTAGLIAALVGFSSSFAVVLEGLSKLGATPAEAASGLMALSITMGACGIFLSLRYRMPISIAWSTPGAAFLAASASASARGNFAAAVGAFLAAGALVIISGLWKPLGRLVSAIPKHLASAMLAGILLPLCLAPARAVMTEPAVGLAIVLTWAIVGTFRKLYAVPAAVVVAGTLIAVTARSTTGPLGMLWPHPVVVRPEFSAAAIIGIAFPLYLITMASQNIPGMAVLEANGYHPRPGPLFSWTGLFSAAAAPFGGHAVNLAAITAALCAGDEAGPDTRKRYWAAVVAGGSYIALGLGAGAAVAFVSASPPILIEAVAGLALLSALGNSLMGAVADPDNREAAAVTFVVTVSGVAFAGIGGAFWGLVAGGALHAVRRWHARQERPAVARDGGPVPVEASAAPVPGAAGDSAVAASSLEAGPHDRG